MTPSSSRKVFTPDPPLREARPAHQPPSSPTKNRCESKSKAPPTAKHANADTADEDNTSIRPHSPRRRNGGRGKEYLADDPGVWGDLEVLVVREVRERSVR